MASTIEAVFKAFELDPEGASVLVDEAVAGWMSEYARAHAGLLQPHLAHRVAATTALAKRALARSYVETLVGGHYPDEEVQKTATWLAGIDAYTAAVLADVGKADEWEEWELSNGEVVRRKVRRDAGGRFAHTIATRAEISPEGAPRLSPALARVRGSRNHAEWERGLSEAQKTTAARHQGQWEQADRYARDLAGAYTGRSDGVNVVLNVLSETGTQRQIELPLRDVKKHGLGEGQVKDINPFSDTILAVHVAAGANAPAEAQRDVVRFNVTGGTDASTLGRLARVPAASWTQALAGRDYTDNERSRLGQVFGNLTGASQVLAAVPGTEKAQAFAGLVGDLGPVAEQALGPHVRRAAYRYRGTEKRPDDELRRDYASQEMEFVRRLAEASPPEPRDAILERSSLGARDRKGHRTPLGGSAAYRASQGAEGDQLKMQVASDVAASHLVSALPADSITARLSEKSGHVLPSQGVILDADGNLVSQAVGYADDHYLPFDLKNVGRLNGGQYVRTRVQGGLTGEDIYTAVQTGARMVTVVSGSGVYTLELDPAFRGARGRSDKARSMYERYLKILDAVESSGLYLQDLEPAEKDKVARATRALYPDLDPKDLKPRVDAAIERARREKLVLDDDDLDALEAQAAQQAAKELPGGSHQEVARRRADLFEDLKREQMEGKVVPLALNAQGYDVALQTLRQQFPYFIRRVAYEPLTGRGQTPGFFQRRFLDESPARNRTTGAKDRGYVRPGGLRPAGVRGGYYNPAGTDLAPKERPPGWSATSGMKPAEKKPPEATGDTSGAEAAGVKPAAGVAAPPAAAGGLAGMLSALKPAAEAQVVAGAKSMADGLRELTKATHEGQADKLSWDAALGGSNVMLVQRLIDEPSLIAERVKAPRVQAALGDRDAAREAFNRVYGGGALEDDINARKDTMASLFGGATNASGVADWFVGQAGKIAQAGSLTDPFVELKPEGAERAFYKGPRPQGFEQIAALGRPGQAEAYRKSPDGRRIGELADFLFTDDDGNPLAPDQAAKRVASLVDQLKDVQRAVDSTRTFARQGQGEFSHDGVAEAAGMTPDELRAALGDTTLDTGRADEQVQMRALEIQQAWALAQVERSHQLMPGGGAGPKAPEEEGYAKASSPRSAPVLAWDHPLAKELRAARASGLLPERSHQL